MKQTIDQIMGVRSQIVHELKTEFGDSSAGIEVDEKTGALIFNIQKFFFPMISLN